MRTLLLVPCAQGGVMHSLGRSLRRAEEPNIIFEDGPWGVLQTSSAYSVCKFRGKIVLLDISFQLKCALYATKNIKYVIFHTNDPLTSVYFRGLTDLVQVQSTVYTKYQYINVLVQLEILINPC